MALTPHEFVSQPSSKLFLGDSWFSSVQAAEAVALKDAYAIIIIKADFIGSSPKNWLEEEIKDYQREAWIFLEGTTSTGVILLTNSNNYCQRELIMFVMTKSTGSILSGEPYKTRFQDAYRNMYIQDVPRLAVLNHYFKHCGAVYTHNNLRQGSLVLKEFSHFSIWTTIIGMQVTNLWKIYRKNDYML